MARWFSEQEVVGLDPRLVDMLDSARGFAKVPFIVTSGRRSEAENDASGGVGSSSHLRGLAVDLACTGSRTRYRMISGLLLAGFNRIGVYTEHIHADVDESLPPDVMWTGKSH